MSAIDIPHTFCIEKSPKRTASERSRLHWKLAATVSFLLSVFTFVAGSAVSAFTALALIPSRPSTAYVTVCLLVGSLGLAFLGAHAMDKLDRFNC